MKSRSTGSIAGSTVTREVFPAFDGSSHFPVLVSQTNQHLDAKHLWDCGENHCFWESCVKLTTQNFTGARSSVAAGIYRFEPVTRPCQKRRFSPHSPILFCRIRGRSCWLGGDLLCLRRHRQITPPEPQPLSLTSSVFQSFVSRAAGRGYFFAAVGAGPPAVELYWSHHAFTEAGSNRRARKPVICSKLKEASFTTSRF